MPSCFRLLIHDDTVTSIKQKRASWLRYRTSLAVALCACVALSAPVLYVIWLITELSQRYAMSLMDKSKQLRRDKKT